MKRAHIGLLTILAASALACAHGGAANSGDSGEPSIESVIEKAKAQAKPVVLFFHAEW